MKVDARGNIFIAGIFKFNVDFDPGAGTAILSSGIDYDVFILKLNSSGNFQWVKQIGDVDYDFVRCLTLDNQGNIIWVGPLKITMM